MKKYSGGKEDLPKLWEGETYGHLVTAKEVGHYLKLTEPTIYKLAAEGEIHGVRVGRSWRFDLEKIIKGIQSTPKNTKTSL